jgi:hypothetical protein
MNAVLRALETVGDEDNHLILIGGQALSTWVAVLEALGHEFESEPIASGDIDFFASQKLVRECAARLEGKAKTPNLDDATPNSGLVSFIDDEGFTREIDFLDQVAGLDADDVRKTAQSVVLDPEDGREPIRVWLLHPERCLESRVHNVLYLDKATKLGLAQARAAVQVARAFTQVVVMDFEEISESERSRVALNLNERIFKFALGRKGIDIYLDYGIDVFGAILLDDRLPTKFGECRYPQMRTQLEDKRERLRQA